MSKVTNSPIKPVTYVQNLSAVSLLKITNVGGQGKDFFTSADYAITLYDNLYVTIVPKNSFLNGRSKPLAVNIPITAVASYVVAE